MRGPFYNDQTGVTGERLMGVANDGHTRLVEETDDESTNPEV